jgi:hypothetical protein
MKIFSAFDTQHKYNELWENQTLHGEDKAFLIVRSKLYYTLFFVLPNVITLLLTIGAIILISSHFTGTQQIYAVSVVGVIGIIVMISIRYGSYIHYHLDFMIVTPEKINIYDQRNIIHRNVKSLFAHEIK